MNVTCSRSCSNTHFKSLRHSSSSREKRSRTLKGRKCPRPSPLLFLKQCCVCDTEFPCRPAESKKKSTCGALDCVSKNRSRKLKGKTGGPRPGGGWGKATVYGNITWDSTWEARLARRLDELGIRWFRSETKEHAISYVNSKSEIRNYYPDVFLPDHDCYIEVKGFWNEETPLKIEAASKKIKLIVLNSLEEIDQFTGV